MTPFQGRLIIRIPSDHKSHLTKNTRPTGYKTASSFLTCISTFFLSLLQNDIVMLRQHKVVNRKLLPVSVLWS